MISPAAPPGGDKPRPYAQTGLTGAELRPSVQTGPTGAELRPSVQQQRRRRIRLDLPVYAEAGIASVTVAVRERRPVFANRDVAAAAVQVSRDLSHARGVQIFAYCVMPDHVHLVLAPAAACDGVTFVGQFKNLAQRAAWAHSVAGAFWQRSFWDRLVRVGEPLEPLVEYVLSNPVRAGLVQTWSEYPDAGSLTWEL